MSLDPRDIREAEAERIISWSPRLQRWCICNGLAKILATTETKEEAEAIRNTPQAHQLELL